MDAINKRGYLGVHSWVLDGFLSRGADVESFRIHDVANGGRVEVLLRDYAAYSGYTFEELRGWYMLYWYYISRCSDYGRFFKLVVLGFGTFRYNSTLLLRHLSNTRHLGDISRQSHYDFMLMILCKYINRNLKFKNQW